MGIVGWINILNTRERKGVISQLLLARPENWEDRKSCKAVIFEKFTVNRRSSYGGRRRLFLKKTGTDNSQKRESKRRRNTKIWLGKALLVIQAEKKDWECLGRRQGLI